MTAPIVNMADCTHSAVRNISDADPVLPKVAGYATGTADVQWTDADWALFPHSGKVRINQGEHPVGITGWDVADVERYALRPGDVPALLEQRIAAEIEWTTIYGSSDTLQQVEAALSGSIYRKGWYYGRVDCWLVDVRLNFGQAAAIVGELVHGFTCRAVQWADPMSNPTTTVPGTHMTLEAANADLSVAETRWHPAPASAPLPDRTSTLVIQGKSLTIRSADDGHSWALA